MGGFDALVDHGPDWDEAGSVLDAGEANAFEVAGVGRRADPVAGSDVRLGAGGEVVALAAVTTAATPLNLTELAPPVVLKPLPKRVTLVPAGPLLGEKLAIANVLTSSALTAVMLPAASYAYCVLVPSGATT